MTINNSSSNRALKIIQDISKGIVVDISDTDMTITLVDGEVINLLLSKADQYLFSPNNPIEQKAMVAYVINELYNDDFAIQIVSDLLRNAYSANESTENETAFISHDNQDSSMNFDTCSENERAENETAFISHDNQDSSMPFDLYKSFYAADKDQTINTSNDEVDTPRYEVDSYKTVCMAEDQPITNDEVDTLRYEVDFYTPSKGGVCVAEDQLINTSNDEVDFYKPAKGVYVAEDQPITNDEVDTLRYEVGSYTSSKGGVCVAEDQPITNDEVYEVDFYNPVEGVCVAENHLTNEAVDPMQITGELHEKNIQNNESLIKILPDQYESYGGLLYNSPFIHKINNGEVATYYDFSNFVEHFIS